MSPSANEVTPAEARLGGIGQNPFFLCLFLSLAIVTAYWPVTHADFINYDDTDYVAANSYVQSGLNWKNIRWAFTSNHASNWHPLTWLSHMLDVSLFGSGATGPHCVNLLLHVGNSILLFALLRRMTDTLWSSYIVALLFALHPLHVESVAWVAERKDVLSTCFGLATLLAYTRYVSAKQQPGAKSPRWYALVLLFFALGLMSKPMLVTLPCVMLLLDVWPLRRLDLCRLTANVRPNLGLLLEKSPLLLLSAISCGLTTWAQQNAIQSLEYLPLSDRIANSVVAYSRYLIKMIYPMNLGLPYLHPGQWPLLYVTSATIAIIGISLLVLTTLRKHPYLFVGWAWFLGTLIPVIGLVQVGAQSIADRYTYFPLIGIFIAIVWAMAPITKQCLPRKIIAGTAILVVGTCGILTHRQAGYWHNSISLFQHSAEVTEGNFIALGNVGGAFFQNGKYNEAMDYYQRSHQINPCYPEAVNSIGAVLTAQGKEAEAVEWFRKALELQPSHADALFNFGNAMAKQGNTPEAVRYFSSALKIRPDNFEAHNNLGNALLKLGRIDDAIVSYQAALEYKSDAALIRKNLGEMFAAKGRLDDAIAQYRQALQQTNDAGTHYSLGLTLAVQGKWTEAIQHYEATLNLSPDNAEAHYNLGYAFRMTQQLEAAKKEFRSALAIKPDFALAHFNLGCVLSDLQQHEEAAAQLREAIRLNPNYQEARHKLDAITNIINH